MIDNNQTSDLYDKFIRMIVEYIKKYNYGL